MYANWQISVGPLSVINKDAKHTAVLVIMLHHKFFKVKSTMKLLICGALEYSRMN